MKATSLIDMLHGGLGGAVVTGGAAMVVMVFVRALGGVALSFPMMILAIMLAALVGGFIQRTVVGTAGKAALGIVAPSGDTTAYVPTFSHIEALEVRGDLDGAAEAWAHACTMHPANALVHVKAADFHLRLRKDPAAALALYRTARDLPEASRELVRYAQSKIVDLHLGPLGEPGRALVELRRMIEAFPGTREADEARAALARLKAEHHGGGAAEA